MELIVISPSKVKIMLTPPDMRKYRVSASAGAPAPGPGLRELLADIEAECGITLTEDRLLVDLYTSETGCELFLTRLGPRTERGLEGSPTAELDPAPPPIPPSGTPENNHLTAKKPKSPGFTTAASPGHNRASTVAASGAKTPDPPHASLTEAEAALLNHIRETEAETVEKVLAFDRLDDLLRLCRRLKAVGYTGESRAYIEEPHGHVRHTQWYLWLAYTASAPTSPLSTCYAFTSEYAPTVDPDYARICRGEYWRVLVGAEAVTVLGPLA